MKRYFLLNSLLAFSLLFSVSHFASAQDIIDEDFLETLEKNANLLWEELIPAFNYSQIPDKYKNESAVILGYRRMVSIDKKSRAGFLLKGERSLIFLENVRFSIQLNDRNSVRNFTEIYFRYTDKMDGFSARIKKPDGSFSRVALDRAVSVESVSSVPEFFKSYFDKENEGAGSYYKVAIPDLNPGDVFEYVTNTRSKLNVKNSGYIEFTPQVEICNKNYPILFNQIIIETDEKSYFKSMALNGAPSFQKETAGDPELFRYVFTDTDRGVEKDVNFINSQSVYPLVKFQVIYANSDKVKGALVGNRGENKSRFTKEELARKAWEDYEQVGSELFNEQNTVDKVVDAVWKELVSLGYRVADNDRFIEKACYKIRNLVVNRDSYLSDKMAAFILGSVLYQREIKSDLIICVPNSMRDFNDVLFEQEIRYVIRVGDKFYFNCTDHSNPGELVESLLGVDAWVLSKPPGKGSMVQVRQLKLPDASASDNTGEFIVNAALADKMGAIKVKRGNTYNGISKNREIGSALQYTPYVFSDHESYGGRSYMSYLSGNQLDEYYKYMKTLREDFVLKKQKIVVEDLEKEFKHKVKYINFEITSDGRTTLNPELKFTEEFELSGLVRKAGKKILVNLPGLVGSQLQIKNEERERKYDINVSYARTLNWTIRFLVPEGYTAEGLQELNSTVENEAGLFSCSAEMGDSNIVKLNIRKVYKKARMPKEKWTEMLAFVDAAYNNSFKYILLKPKK